MLTLEATTINQIMCALRFLYGTTLDKKDASEEIKIARQSDPLPAVLSRDEVAQFLKAVPDLRWRTVNRRSNIASRMTIGATGSAKVVNARWLASTISKSSMIALLRGLLLLPNNGDFIDPDPNLPAARHRCYSRSSV